LSANDGSIPRENNRPLASPTATLAPSSTRQKVIDAGAVPAPTPSGGNGLVSLVVFGGLCFAGYKFFNRRPKVPGVIWAFSGVRHFHQAAHSEWVGRRGSLSVRVMKGVWYRSGRNHGHREQHSSMDDEGVGTLVLTTKALCFVGANSARLPFSHILALETLSDGIGLDTYYAKNTKHEFGRMNSDNVTFLKTAMDLVNAKTA
jgi:hypothetical protein